MYCGTTAERLRNDCMSHRSQDVGSGEMWWSSDHIDLRGIGRGYRYSGPDSLPKLSDIMTFLNHANARTDIT